MKLMNTFLAISLAGAACLGQSAPQKPAPSPPPARNTPSPAPSPPPNQPAPQNTAPPQNANGQPQQNNSDVNHTKPDDTENCYGCNAPQ
jgi:hypothetical protein